MFWRSLTGRFLGLMIVFVLIAEALIFLPSVSRFRVEYLQSRLELAQLAALALLATPDEIVAPEVEDELLNTAGVINIVLRREAVRELVLASPMPPPVNETFDLRAPNDLVLIRDAMRVYLQPDRVIRVIGVTRLGEGGEIEVTLEEGPLREAMIAYGGRILILSAIISIATAALLFLAVQYLIVGPMRRVVASMTAYRDDPEDPSRIITPASEVAELRQAELALKDMQQQLTQALRQKDRLAALGGAVARISHDLRNTLTTAQLLADRMEASADPAVARRAPKLVQALSRAISLCERTLAYGRAEEPAPQLASVALGPLLAEVIEAETLASPSPEIRIENAVAAPLTVRADPDHLYRILTNLLRNAVQAIAATGRPGRVQVMAQPVGERIEIRIIDDGPGLPAKARDHLFKPFQGGARQGGSGLGLAIAAELARGQGGSLTLVESTGAGTTFALALPRA